MVPTDSGAWYARRFGVHIALRTSDVSFTRKKGTIGERGLQAAGVATAICGLPNPRASPGPLLFGSRIASRGSGRAPAEPDFRKYFRGTPPIVRLEEKGMHTSPPRQGPKHQSCYSRAASFRSWNRKMLNQSEAERSAQSENHHGNRPVGVSRHSCPPGAPTGPAVLRSSASVGSFLRSGAEGSGRASPGASTPNPWNFRGGLVVRVNWPSKNARWVIF